MIDRAAAAPLMPEQTSNALRGKTADEKRGGDQLPRSVRIYGTRLGEVRKAGVRPSS